MAIGDLARAAGYQLVPDSGEEGRVRHGAREINRTRDLIAAVLAKIPKGKPEARAQAGITSGWGEPTGGADGDIYFKIIE